MQHGGHKAEENRSSLLRTSSSLDLQSSLEVTEVQAVEIPEIRQQGKISLPWGTDELFGFVIYHIPH